MVYDERDGELECKQKVPRMLENMIKTVRFLYIHTARFSPSFSVDAYFAWLFFQVA